MTPHEYINEILEEKTMTSKDMTDPTQEKHISTIIGIIIRLKRDYSLSPYDMNKSFGIDAKFAGRVLKEHSAGMRA